MKPRDDRTVKSRNAGDFPALVACMAFVLVATLYPEFEEPSEAGGDPVGNSVVLDSSTDDRLRRYVDFGSVHASPEVRYVAQEVVSSSDNGSLSFIVVDKRNAMLFVFDENGELKGSTAVLLGSARGDDSVPGIGEREISQIRPEERTTPAGRFVGEHGRNLKGEDIVWVDYDAAVSLHRVRPADPGERRLERLASRSSGDNRISYGCINVPVGFYEQIVLRSLSEGKVMIYVLPETRDARSIIGRG